VLRLSSQILVEVVAICDLLLGHIDQHITDLKHFAQTRLPVCVGV